MIIRILYIKQARLVATQDTCNRVWIVQNGGPNIEKIKATHGKLKVMKGVGFKAQTASNCIGVVVRKRAFIGSLTEEIAKMYLCEIILAIEYLH
jgi:hypothetical protein